MIEVVTTKLVFVAHARSVSPWIQEGPGLISEGYSKALVGVCWLAALFFSLSSSSVICCCIWVSLRTDSLAVRRSDRQAKITVETVPIRLTIAVTIPAMPTKFPTPTT